MRACTMSIGEVEVGLSACSYAPALPEDGGGISEFYSYTPLRHRPIGMGSAKIYS